MSYAMPPTESPSWAMPISIAAALTVVGFGLLHLLAGLGQMGATASCCCLGPSAFAPVGFLTAVWARRRDPLLTPGQAFAIVFIGAGLGSVALAALVSLSMMPTRDELFPAVARSIDEMIARQSQSVPAEDREAMIESAVALAPYAPLFFAAWHTVAAALVALFTASLSQRRYEPPLHMGDPTN